MRFLSIVEIIASAWEFAVFDIRKPGAKAVGATGPHLAPPHVAGTQRARRWLQICAGLEG
jgi:hypothetical protein